MMVKYKVTGQEMEFLREKYDSQKHTRVGELVLRLTAAYQELREMVKTNDSGNKHVKGKLLH